MTTKITFDVLVPTVITILGWKGEVGWLAGVCWHVYMSVQSSPINQRFVILLQCLWKVWYEVHCFFCTKSGFLHEWLFGEKVCRFAHVSLSNSDTSTVCHCKHGSGYVFALLWKELWWWWVHLNYEDASMLIADLAEPPVPPVQLSALEPHSCCEKRLSGRTICKICNKKVIHNDIMLITRMLGWFRIKQSSALEPPA